MAKQHKLNRVPPFIPLLWQDWRSSADIASMTPTQRSLYLDILIEQWIYGDVPRDPYKLHKKINPTGDYRTTVRFLSAYSHLIVCSQCYHGWKTGCCPCGACDSTGTCLNLKLKNLRIDVNSDLPLGTTELNPTEPDRREPHLAPPAEAGEGRGVAFTSLQGEICDQATPKTPSPTDDPLVNEFVALLGQKPSTLSQNYWSTVFAKLVKLHGEPHFRNVMAYCFQNERYCRGVKTTGKDKADWFADKFEGMADKMLADSEFESKRSAKVVAAKVPANAPDYRKNPTGRNWFGNDA
jgi:hypothetical protein